MSIPSFIDHDLHCAYHSGGAEHIIEDCINLKHKMQDLLYQKVVTLHTSIRNVNSNLMSSHRLMIINVVKVKEDCSVEKVIISTNLEKLNKFVSSPTKRENYEFRIIPPHHVFVLAPKEALNKQKIDQVFPKSLPHSYQSFPMQNLLGGKFIQKR